MALGSLASLALSATAMAAPAVTVVTNTPHPSQVVTVSGTGFAASEAVDVYIDTTDTLLLVSSTTGTLCASLTVPASASPGSHYVKAIGRKSGDAAQIAFIVTTPWAQSGFGAAHLSSNPYENTVNPYNVASLGLLWSAQMASGGGTPAVAHNYVYVGTLNDGVQALSATTGAVLWTAAKSDRFYGSPAVAGGSVYIAGFSGLV